MKQIRFEGGGSRAQKAKAAVKPKVKTNLKKQEQTSKSYSKDITKAKVTINLYKQGKLGHLDMRDALKTMGYSDKEIDEIVKKYGQEDPKDLFEAYFVNPHFSDEE